MKSIKNYALLVCFTLLSTSQLFPESQNQEELTCVPEPSTKRVGTNPYTYSPQLFTADNDITGRYWAGNKKYPAKAFIGEEEYTHIIVIKKSQINQKSKKRLRKHKDYLGFYINAATNIAYNLYGDKKYPDKINDAPDADVITMIAIKEDYGIGE